MAEPTYWHPRILESAADMEVEPPRMDAIEAQQWCNFVVWTPTRLPGGTQMENATLRKEAPPGRVGGSTAGRTPWSANNPAAYRYEIVGSHRRLRVKQFLYDWAFPAADQPCLWESETRAFSIDGRYVVWLGVDYMSNKAATARLARTNIEVSVLEGEFTDEEIVDFYRSLLPASASAAGQIGNTPFVHLGYWQHRTDALMLDVPYGLLKFRRHTKENRDHEGHWATAQEARSDLAEFELPQTCGSFEADSVARYDDGLGGSEIEIVYVGGVDRGHELRLIAQWQGKGRLDFPAAVEDHPCEIEQVTIKGQPVTLAFITDDYGPFDATWQNTRTGIEAKLLSSASPTMNRLWFVEALSELL